MAHADHIWPALACLRRGELPQAAGIDALVALARGECTAPQPPLLPESDDPLAAEWSAAYEAETLAPCPTLARKERAALRSASLRMPRSELYYGFFHRWRVDGPQWAASVQPTPSAFSKHLDSVIAWSGPKMRAENQKAKDAAEVALLSERPAAAADGNATMCAPPSGGFAALVKTLAARRSLGGNK